uniref:Tetratricopeptide repeat protein 19, mitochondrial n=1 Tax=Chrysemys picta bellii TaxID=8478 RepID=A0A8C3I6N5_CHRPI
MTRARHLGCSRSSPVPGPSAGHVGGAAQGAGAAGGRGETLLRGAPTGPVGQGPGQARGRLGSGVPAGAQLRGRPGRPGVSYWELLGGSGIFPSLRFQLSIMKGELEEAERILHEAVRLSHQSDNKKAIIYTYDLVILPGKLLIVAAPSNDDNAIIEMSLKLASIYAAQNQHKLALAGYEFCILTLDEKIAKYKDLPEDVLPAEERANTYLLLGLCLDSYGRYLLANKQLPGAQRMYERALQISKEVQGDTHPQTVVLMNDLATVLDAQGLYEEAYTHVKRASELAKQTEHPEEHMVLNNLAGILMHKEDFLQAKEVYRKALKQAELKGDTASMEHIEEELAELARRRKHSN